MTSDILTVESAAALLHCSEDHLRELARAGKVPAAKPGKAWVFRATRLLEWLDAGCPANVSANNSDNNRERKCRSTKSKALASGTSTSRTTARELDDLLAQTIGGKRRSITTASKPTSGAVISLASARK